MPANLGKDIDENDEVEQTPTSQISPEVLAEIKKGAQAEIFAQLQQDDAIRAVLQLRQAGKTPQVVEEGVDRAAGTESQPVADPPSPPDISKMTEQEKMRYLVSMVSKETTKLVDEKLQPLGKRLEQIEGFGAEIKKNEVVNQVQQLKTKYGEAEFEALKPQMASILQRHPTLSAEELFQMAKLQRGDMIPAAKLASSEKPSASTGKPHNRREVKPGVGGMRELLAGATGRIYDSLSAPNEE